LRRRRRRRRRDKKTQKVIVYVTSETVISRLLSLYKIFLTAWI